MTNEKMERQLAVALEKTAPDDVDGVLSRCETRKGTVINIETKKTTKRKRNLRKSTLVDETNVKTMKKIMPYL